MGMTSIGLSHIDEKARVQDCLDKIRTASSHLMSLKGTKMRSKKDWLIPMPSSSHTKSSRTKPPVSGLWLNRTRICPPSGVYFTGGADHRLPAGTGVAACAHDGRHGGRHLFNGGHSVPSSLLAKRGHGTKALTPGVWIVAMTANAFVEDMRMSKEAGMNEHVSKPVDLERLQDSTPYPASRVPGSRRPGPPSAGPGSTGPGGSAGTGLCPGSLRCLTDARRTDEIEDTETKGYVLRARANMSLGGFHSPSEKIGLARENLRIMQDPAYQSGAPELPCGVRSVSSGASSNPSIRLRS